jgi:hypothetical protein
MAALKRFLVPMVVVAAGLALASCSREITRIEQVPQQLTCFTCHSDTSTALVAAAQQWDHSKHASGETLNENDSTCKGCHTSEGFVARSNDTTPSDVIDNPTSIHCFTCHAPHTNGDFRLRWTSIATLQNGATYDLKAGNLCVACHQSRRNVATYIAAKPALTSLNNRFGPHHGPQGDVLIGSNGYEFKNFTYERSNHRSVTGDGCIDCHMKTTSQNVVGGHSWNMAWSTGTDEILNTDACTRCHSGTINDFSDIGPGYSVQDSTVALIATLAAKLQAANLVGTDGLPKTAKTNADSAGAVWNYMMAKEDRSEGVHNPKYIQSLLRSSIQFIDGTLPQTALVTDRR